MEIFQLELRTYSTKDGEAPEGNNPISESGVITNRKSANIAEVHSAINPNKQASNVSPFTSNVCVYV